jgi:hypothetical protein
LKSIKLITFKGCKSTLDLRDQIETMVDKDIKDVKIEMVFISSFEKAYEIGLYGSPTIIIDGLEYQQEFHGPVGFY